MPSGRLADRLSDPPAPTCSTLADGCVDRFCSLAVTVAGVVAFLERRATVDS